MMKCCIKFIFSCLRSMQYVIIDVFWNDPANHASTCVRKVPCKYLHAHTKLLTTQVFNIILCSDYLQPFLTTKNNGTNETTNNIHYNTTTTPTSTKYNHDDKNNNTLLPPCTYVFDLAFFFYEAGPPSHFSFLSFSLSHIITNNQHGVTGCQQQQVNTNINQLQQSSPKTLDLGMFPDPV